MICKRKKKKGQSDMHIGSKKPYNLTPEGLKTKQKVGNQNLQTWKAKNPGKQNLKHGAHSQTIRKRFDDLRTNQGKALAAVIKGLVDHFGGPEHVTAPMQLLIDAGIRPKLITLMCINEYINKQFEIVNGKGELITCLNNNYISYSNALRLDLTALTDMAKSINKSKVPTIEDLIASGK